MSRLLAVLLALVTLAFASFAFASPSGEISLSPKGPVELSPSGSSYSGSFFVENHGQTPLTVSRVSVRTDSDDPRVPAKVTVKPEKATPFVLAPRERARVEIAWSPDASARQRQALGHVVVTSTDESAGEVAMGFRAQMPTPLALVTDRPLSVLVLLPLLIAAGLMILHAVGRAPRSARPIAIGVAALQTVIAVWLWHAFDPSITKADGNDGMQFVEHAAWIRGLAAEWFVGVDGTNLAAIVSTCAIALAGAVATPAPSKDAVAFDALMLVVGAAGLGALVAQDALLWLSFVALLSIGVLVTLSHFAEDARASRLAAPFFAVGFAALALALMMLHAQSGKTFLVGGESVQAGWSLPELARVSFVLKTTKAFGQPLVAAAWSLSFVSALAYAGAFPLHSWLPRVMSSAPPSLAALVIATVTSCGLHTLVRVTTVLPEGARWAATTVLLLGLLGAGYGALCALAQRDLARMAGFAMVVQSGLVLCAFGSLTQQGLAGVLVAIPARAVAGALMVLACGALHSRLRTRDVLRVSGLAKDAPLLTGALAVGALGAMAAPGTCAGWLTILASFGALPRGVGAALGVAFAAAVLAIALGRALLRVASGSLSRELAAATVLEPFGGRVPDLETPQLLALLALSLVVVVFGVHPAPLLSVGNAPVAELGAVLNPPGPGEIAQN